LPSREPAASTQWRSYQADGRLLEASAYPGARALRGEVVTPGIDFLHKSEDGKENWIRVSATPFRQETGQITGAVVVLQDIDNAKRTENALLALISELHHRTRNLLGLVKSLSDETLASCSSLGEYAAAFGGRLSALSRVQSLLARGNDRSVTLTELLHLELQALANEPHEQRVSITGPEVALPTESLQVLALAIHELATHARKHGALRTDAGQLAVSWAVTTGAKARELKFIWQENGPMANGDSAAPRRRGLGVMLLEETLPFQLDAETSLEFGSNGLCCTITMAIE
jgi:two-component sensor histidine kinase